jgi:ATP-binding cassette subfamily B multidrug efflux pump
MTKQPSVLRRLLGYALLFRTKMAIALLILLLSVAAQLSGPYIVKVIIDQHIAAATELTWYQVDPQELSSNISTVTLYEKTYVRSDWIPAQDIQSSWPEVTVSQIESSQFSIQSAENNEQLLSPDDVYTLYQHDITPVVQLISLYVALLLVGGFLAFAQGYLLQSAALHIIQKMRHDVMKHIHSLPVRFFDNTPIGQVVTRITNDTEAIKELFMSFMATFVVSGAHLLGIYVFLFILDVQLALICLLIVPLFYIIMKLHLRFSKSYIEKMRARLSDMNAMLNETISVMPIIKAFRRERATTDEFEHLNHDRYVNQIKQFRVFSISSRNITNLIGGLAATWVIWYYGGASLNTAISFGVLFAFIDYLGRIFPQIIGIFDQLTNAQRAVVSAERVFHLLDMEGIPAEPSEAIQRPHGHVKFDGVSFAYKDEEYVLKDISFEAKQGDTIAIVGHTGSGKSSIMNLLLGFYEPKKGAITIDGRDITGMPKQELRKHMGIVLQDPFLFAGDIKFNVNLYNEEIDLEKVKQAIKDVGAEAFVQQLPHGYDEVVVERGSTLSSGQRQLISFARALAFNPAILILDEATSSIDSETEGIIQEALKVLVQGRTTFVIAHRLSTIKQADRILVMHRGEIVESGTHEELMKLEGRYYKMVQLQKDNQSVIGA